MEPRGIPYVEVATQSSCASAQLLQNEGYTAPSHTSWCWPDVTSALGSAWGCGQGMGWQALKDALVIPADSIYLTSLKDRDCVPLILQLRLQNLCICCHDDDLHTSIA